METFFTIVGFITAMLLIGIGMGIGFAFGLEMVMRFSGDGRTVLLTFARTKVAEDA